MKIELKPLDQITPYARNPRRNQAAIGVVKASLKEYGWQQPIVVDGEGVIIAGHTRYLAALELGWTEAPVYVARDLTPAQVKAYRLMDNKSHERAEWDTELLALEMEDLKGMEFDLELTGFDMEELAGIRLDSTPATEGDTEPQIGRAEELRVQWGVETGQLWQLGEHRLLCGDSTKAEDVARVMAEERADIVFTSPPYNRGTTTGGGFNDGGLSQQLTSAYLGYSDDLAVDDYRRWQADLLRSWWDLIADDGAIFYNHRPRVQAGIYETPFDWNPGLPVRQVIIWHSGAGINFAPTHYRIAHEWIVLFAKPDFRLNSKGQSGIGDVWQFGVTRVAGHPAPFPIEIPSTAIETTKSNIIYEPFSGSGTTIIAGENLGRKVRAIEISPGYVSVALQRYLDHTGKTPVLLP